MVVFFDHSARAPSATLRFTADLAKTRALATKTKARAEALVDHVVEKKHEMGILFYEIGDALHTLLEDKLYASLGYESFDALVEDRNLMSLTQAKKLIEVRRTFGRAQALTLGQRKATPSPATPRARKRWMTRRTAWTAAFRSEAGAGRSRTSPSERFDSPRASRCRGNPGSTARTSARGSTPRVSCGRQSGAERSRHRLRGGDPRFPARQSSVTLAIPAHRVRSALKLPL